MLLPSFHAVPHQLPLGSVHTHTKERSNGRESFWDCSHHYVSIPFFLSSNNGIDALVYVYVYVYVYSTIEFVLPEILCQLSIWIVSWTFNPLSFKLLLQSTIPRQVWFLNCECHLMEALVHL